LEREPVAAYFFGSEAPEPLRTPKTSSQRPIPPRLTGSGTSLFTDRHARPERGIQKG
jgi:hypothetical protein